MTFANYVTRRLLHTVVTLAMLMVFMFTLFRLIPGDPTTMLLGSGELPPEAQQQLRLMWGLDRPMWAQFIDYVVNLAHGNLGMSFYFRRRVTEVVAPMLGNSLVLMAPVVGLAIFLGVIGGTWLGWHRGSRAEEIGAILAVIIRSLPVFWIGIILLSLFAYQLRWFPIGGMREAFFIPMSGWQTLPGYDLVRHLVLPVITGVLVTMADPLMIQRTSLLEVRGEDFMVLAQARGLSTHAQRRLARRNAILPVLTYSAILVGFAFGGQVLLEVMFNWPGIGRLMVDSVTQRDYPVAQATFFLMATIVVMMNLLVDLAYGWLDPRIRYE